MLPGDVFCVSYHTGPLQHCAKALLALTGVTLLAQGQLAAMLRTSGDFVPLPAPPLTPKHVNCQKSAECQLRLDPAEAMARRGQAISCQHGIPDSRSEAGSSFFLAGSHTAR